MLLKMHGMPLYVPQPLTRHAPSYQRQGVSIGDVGVFTQFGEFDRLFNICLPANHSMNPQELPDGFYPLDLNPGDVSGPNYRHDLNSYITSPPVRMTGLVADSCYVSEILTMAFAGQHFNALNLTVLF